MSVFAPGVVNLWRTIDSYGIDPGPMFAAEGIDIRPPIDPSTRLSYEKIDRIRAQALAGIQRIGHGLQVAGIYRLHLAHHVQDAGDSLSDFAYFRVGNPNFGQLGNFFYLGLFYRHVFTHCGGRCELVAVGAKLPRNTLPAGAGSCAGDANLTHLRLAQNPRDW